jgi:hypothetical protein
MWDKTAAVKHLDDNAEADSIGECAKYVRMAVEAGGVILERHALAKDYGPSLIAVGFRVVPDATPLAPITGDVAIVQPIPGHDAGHMTMFDGTLWVSDFKQMHGVYPSEEYRTLKPTVTLYRYPSAPAPAAAAG